MTTDELLLQLGRLQARIDALEAQLSPAPVTSWRGAAAVLGVSVDTIERARAKAGDTTARPWWSSPDAVREWWAEVRAPRPEPTPKPKRPAKPRGAAKVFDAAALMDEVSGRKPARR